MKIVLTIAFLSMCVAGPLIFEGFGFVAGMLNALLFLMLSEVID